MHKLIRWIKRLFIVSIAASLLFLSALGVKATFGSTVSNVVAQAIPSCLNRTNIPIADLHWVYVPETAAALHTEEDYFYLAGQLISNSIVDASTCPNGGLALSGYANACGMSVARPKVIELQNIIDEAILRTWTDVGVPPVLLRQLIRQESQFWPSLNSQTHYGYGHITNMGIRNALEWNPDLRQKVCPAGSGWMCINDQTIVKEILDSLVVTCPTCTNGIDVDAANRSVDILAESVLGYCYQTAQLIYNATGWYSSNAVNYATLWKLTLMDYNAGSQCVFDTVAKTFKAVQGPMSWEDLSARVTGELCIRGKTYANQITAKYYNFPPK
jgi:hypothetical protein